jgi:hypothetical protein
MSGGIGGFNMHIFFPNLPYSGKKKEQYLTNIERKQWFDRIFIPALRNVGSKDVLHHHPSTWDEIRTKARIKKEAYNGNRLILFSYE